MRPRRIHLVGRRPPPMNACLLLLAPALMACSEAPPPARPAQSSVPDVVLVRKLQPDEAGNAAAGGGVLTLKDGCVFMAHPDGSRTLLLWPAHTRIEREPDGGLRIVPGGAGRPIRVGQAISVGGSELWRGERDADLVGPGRPVPADTAFPPGCTGRVWNVYTVEPASPTPEPR